MVTTHLDLGLRCIKYLLFAVNLLFVLSGTMIISIGSTIYAVYDDFSHFLDPSYFSPATLLIVVGTFIFAIAFMGCYGALRESTCLVLVFAVSLSLVLILEFSAAIVAYAKQESIKSLLASKVDEAMHEYESSAETKVAVDFLQSSLRCCGYNGIEDWRDISKGNDTGDVEYPFSCCSRSGAPETDDPAHHSSLICLAPYTDGCIDRLSTLINRSALYLVTGATVIALVQITGIMFACVLGKAIRRQKLERERRSWEMRERLLEGYQRLGKMDPISAFPVVYMEAPNLSSKSSPVFQQQQQQQSQP